MSPGTLANGLVAQDECLRLAKEKNMMPPGEQIDTYIRIKNSKWVVDIVGKTPPSTD
jgi:hypothetical protein